MVQRLVDMSNRPDPSDTRGKVETDISHRFNEERVQPSGGSMIFGRAFHILQAVDIDPNKAIQAHGREVVAVLEEFRGRIRDLAKNPASLKPAPAKRPEKIVCEVPRPRTPQIRADARKPAALKGGLSVKQAEERLWGQDRPDVPDDYLTWNENQILVFLAFVDQQLSHGESITDLLRIYSIPNSTHQHWRKNILLIKARATGMNIDGVASMPSNVKDSDELSAQSSAAASHAASNGDAANGAPAGSMEQVRDPRLPDLGFEGRWLDSQKLILLDLVLARQRSGISVKSTLVPYPVSEPTYYAWVKKRAEIEARAGAAPASHADATTSNGAPSGAEATNGAPPTNGDVSTLQRDERLPVAGFEGRWNDEQKLILINLANTHGGQTGAIRVILELYNVPYPTFCEWRRKKATFEARLNGSPAVVPAASTSDAPAEDAPSNGVQTVAPPAPDVQASSPTPVAAAAPLEPEAVQATVPPAKGTVEIKKRNEALSELGYFPQVLIELSESLEDPLLLTLATLVQQRYEELVARAQAQAAPVTPEQPAAPPADIIAAAETIVAHVESTLEQAAFAVPSEPSEPEAPVAPEAPPAPVATTVALTEVHAEAAQPSTPALTPELDAEALRQRNFKNSVQLKFNGRIDPNFTYESAVRVARERCLAVGFNALKKGKAASGFVGVPDSDIRSFLAMSVDGIIDRYNPQGDGDIMQFYRDQLVIAAIGEFGVRTGRMPDTVPVSDHVHRTSRTSSAGESLRENVVLRWAENNGVRNVYSAYDFVGAMMRRHMRWVYELSERLRRDNSNIGNKEAVDQIGYRLLMSSIKTYDFQDNVTHESFENELSPMIEAAMKGE